MLEGAALHRREPTPQGTNFALPRRSSQKLKGLGCMGLFLTLFGLGFALGPLTFLWSDMAPLFALFVIPFVIAGVAVFAVGLWLLIGYSEILVTNHQVPSQRSQPTTPPHQDRWQAGAAPGWT